MESICLRLGVRADDADRQRRLGLLPVFTWSEIVDVVLDRSARLHRRKEMRECIRQSFSRGSHGGPHRGAEQPDIGRALGRGGDNRLAEWMIRRKLFRMKERQQLR